MIKRIFDFSFSLLAIIILSPLLIPISILLLLTGEHYVFYTQNRIGKFGKEFGLLKFATMLKNSPNIGTGDVTVNNDPRVLPMGIFLRKSKINELPQLLNILKGDMSFIGPRPLTPRVFNYYSELDQKVVKQMKPGLTGVGSIVFRDEEDFIGKSKLAWEECIKQEVMPRKAALEHWYLNNQSFKVDILLIFITAWVIVFPESNIMQKLFNNIPK